VKPLRTHIRVSSRGPPQGGANTQGVFASGAGLYDSRAEGTARFGDGNSWRLRGPWRFSALRLCRATALPPFLRGEADLAVAEDIIEVGSVSLAQLNTPALVLDFAAVTFIDATVLRALIYLKNAADDQGKHSS
jgi:hypothetical protein